MSAGGVQDENQHRGEGEFVVQHRGEGDWRSHAMDVRFANGSYCCNDELFRLMLVAYEELVKDGDYWDTYSLGVLSRVSFFFV